MKNKIISLAGELGISEIGFVSADEFAKKKIYSDSEFAVSPVMTDVSAVLEDAKTIIVWLAPYRSEISPVNMSAYAMGVDYHLFCGEISEKICGLLRDEGYKAVHMTDNNPLCERELAKDAGLGFIGKNHFLINSKYGSYVFISCVVTDCDIDPSGGSVGKCMDCEACVLTCPGGALSCSGFDEKKCISYISQKKGELSEEEENILKKSDSVWGCDICQNVCPMNKNAEYTPFYAFSEDLITQLEYEDISGKAFRKKYSRRAFSWRGKGVIDRNLSIINEKK